jgi:hypothetical protein
MATQGRDGGQAQVRKSENAAPTPKAGANSASPGNKPKRKHYTGRPKGADEARRLDEARSRLTTVRGKIGQFAQELMRELYGEQGPEWGTKLRDIEILSDVIGAEVASRFTEGSVSEQAEHVPKSAEICPCCGGHGTRDDEDEPRSLKTLTGDVNWNEAQYFCKPCRRSFFPSKS